MNSVISQINLSVIILAVTALAIYLQVLEQRKSSKFLEYSIRPTAHFFLFRHLMYIKNTSNFLIKFYFRMSSNGNILNNNHWGDNDNKNGPLFIYPGFAYMQFPEAFDSSKLITDKIKIEYKVVPSHINDIELSKDIQVIEWDYDKITGKWTAPNGVEELGILSFLSKDKQDELITHFNLR